MPLIILIGILHSFWYIVKLCSMQQFPDQTASPFRTKAQRQGDRAAKCHALLLAAARMFNARGFSATTLEDVAASVGVTKPTIYHYLGNKEQVLIECMAIGLTQLQQAAARAHSTPGSAIERLRVFARCYAEVNMSEFGQCVIRTGDEALSAEGLKRLRSLKRPIDSALREFIVQGIEEGSIAPHDPKLMAFTVAGALNWTGRWYQPDGQLQPTEVAEQIVAILESGLARR